MNEQNRKVKASIHNSGCEVDEIKWKTQTVFAFTSDDTDGLKEVHALMKNPALTQQLNSRLEEAFIADLREILTTLPQLTFDLLEFDPCLMPPMFCHGCDYMVSVFMHAVAPKRYCRDVRWILNRVTMNDVPMRNELFRHTASNDLRHAPIEIITAAQRELVYQPTQSKYITNTERRWIQTI